MRTWMRTGAMLAGAAVVLAGGAAWTQNLPSFPRSLERETLLAWLQRETDIMPERVVAVTPQAVTSIVSTFPAGGGQGPRVVIRAEALNSETYARTGALSWHVSLNADCDGRRVRMGETTGYPERNLLGSRRVLRVAEDTWRTPEAGTALDNAWRAACDTKFKGPFQVADLKVAQVDPAAPPTAAAAAPPTAEPMPAAPRAPRPDTPPKPAPVKAAPARPAPALAPIASAGGGPVSVQIGAFPDQASASAALARLGDGQAHGTESAVVGGRTWYRAVVSGFDSAAAAERYCATRRSQGGVCFVRVRARS